MKKIETYVTEYWLAHYLHNGLCSLCGNSGKIDTRGVRSPTGVLSGRGSEFCICPNGQRMREMAARNKLVADLRARNKSVNEPSLPFVAPCCVCTYEAECRRRGVCLMRRG